MDQNPNQNPNQKTSYESSVDVQRWLQEQSLEGGRKPEFTPTFLAGQRDRLWVLSSLAQFYEQDLITDVLRVVKSGKEATVYCCAADPATSRTLLAAKVYRPRMFRSLKNDVVYRQNRAVRDERGRVVRGDRGWRGASKNTERGRAAKITNWIEHEFKTQRLLYEAGADVPCPLAQIGNAMLMDYVGDAEEAAPLLREVDLPREEAQPLFDAMLRNIELFLACDRVHGDLSEYNILYWQGAGTIIDFAQAVDPRYNQDDVFDLLARDIARVCRYFARYGVEADAEALAIDLWTRYLTGALA
ncbi:MAG TPA: RIO1 family regulatory kinase/ATPase [Ktedonobacterales bacterium]|nr:RIO1 family regulatory kinase/ATPase [Ktedonobacterales bacterium]